MPQTKILARSSDLAVTRQPTIQNGLADLRSTSLPLHHSVFSTMTIPPLNSAVSSPRNCPSYSHAASEKLKSVARVVQTRAPGTSFVFSSPYLLLPSLQIEFVRWFRSTGIPMGYAQVVL